MGVFLLFGWTTLIKQVINNIVWTSLIDQRTRLSIIVLVD